MDARGSQFSAWFSAVVGWVFDYYEIFLLTFLVLPIGKAFDLSPGQIATLFSVELLALAIGGIAFGFLGDRFGRKKMLSITVIIYAVFTFARAGAFDYTSLLILTALAAFGIGGEYGVGQTLVSEVMPRRTRGWWSGLLYSGIWPGIMLGALIGGYVAPVIGWRWTFVISGLPILFAIYIRLRAPESEAWSATKGASRGPRTLLTQRVFVIPFLLCLVVGTVEFFAYYGLTTLLPKYLVEREGFELSKAAWWLFFTAVAGLAGSLAASYTMDRWGRRITLAYLAGLAACGGVVLAATWQYMLESGWILLPFFVLYFGSSCPTVFGALFSEQFPTDVRSTGVSSSLQIGRGLAGLAPLAAAAIIGSYGYPAVILIGAGFYVIVGILGWTLKDRGGEDLSEVDATVRGRAQAAGPEMSEST